MSTTYNATAFQIKMKYDTVYGKSLYRLVGVEQVLHMSDTLWKPVVGLDVGLSDGSTRRVISVPFVPFLLLVF